MTVDELQVLITANTNELRKEINKANKNISGLQKSASKGTSGVADAFKKLKTGIVALGIGKVIKDSITSGMDAIESDSLFETSLGNSADDVRNAGANSCSFIFRTSLLKWSVNLLTVPSAFLSLMNATF